jgi:hypothetical protein
LLQRIHAIKHKTKRRKGGTYPFLWQFVGRGLGRLVVDPDRLKASLGDAQGARTVSVATPHRQRTAGLDFLDQTLGEGLATTLPAAPSIRFDGHSRSPSPRCEIAITFPLRSVTKPR